MKLAPDAIRSCIAASWFRKLTGNYAVGQEKNLLVANELMIWEKPLVLHQQAKSESRVDIKYIII